MECLCPNCKGKSELVKVGSVDYIKCPECGWFETQADGSLSACEPPQSEVKETKSLSAKEGDHGETLPPPSPPPSDPLETEDEEDEVKIRLNFED